MRLCPAPRTLLPHARRPVRPSAGSARSLPWRSATQRQASCQLQRWYRLRWWCKARRRLPPRTCAARRLCRPRPSPSRWSSRPTRGRTLRGLWKLRRTKRTPVWERTVVGQCRLRGSSRACGSLSNKQREATQRRILHDRKSPCQRVGSAARDEAEKLSCRYLPRGCQMFLGLGFSAAVRAPRRNARTGVPLKLKVVGAATSWPAWSASLNGELIRLSQSKLLPRFRWSVAAPRSVTARPSLQQTTQPLQSPSARSPFTTARRPR
mmetsp:Transcript_41192/g.93123  ORF Transcript_41192/g.93123 Transcript_41192/m.93123 type:complete len:265 (+) Transcript_41192:438-1232(+)